VRRASLAMVTRSYYCRRLRPRSGSQSAIPPIPAVRVLPSLTTMTKELPIRRVEVSFIGAPPAQQIERATGVSEVEIDGSVLRCLVLGSFQPFLEALRGHEVISLESRSTPSSPLDGGQ